MGKTKDRDCDIRFVCSSCRVVKPLREFHWIEDFGHYWHMCIECEEFVPPPKGRKDGDLRGEFERQDHVKALRGPRSKREISLYKLLWQKQDGVCPICGDGLDSRTTVVIDHNHFTGKLRGLLCQSCNAWIGVSCEDIERFQAAADYLRRHESEDCIG